MIEYEINSDGKYEKLVLHVINQSNDPYSDLSDNLRTPLVPLSVLALSPSPLPFVMWPCVRRLRWFYNSPSREEDILKERRSVPLLYLNQIVNLLQWFQSIRYCSNIYPWIFLIFCLLLPLTYFCVSAFSWNTALSCSCFGQLAIRLFHGNEKNTQRGQNLHKVFQVYNCTLYTVHWPKMRQSP